MLQGAVFKAKYLGPQPKGALLPDQNVAIKITPCDKVRPNEVLLQARIQHINVIRLYDVFRCVLSSCGALCCADLAAQ